MPVNPDGLDYKRPQQKLICHGMDLVHPTNLMPEGKFPRLLNVRAYQDGRIESRAGTSRVNSAPLADLNVHSLSRTNDYVVSTPIRYAGAGTNLYSAPEGGVFTLLDSGYGGTPLSIVPYRPDQSSQVWTYIAEFNKMQKYRSDGTKFAIGVAPPLTPPSVELGQPLYAPAAGNLFDSSGGWTLHGSASGAATGARLVGTTIAALKYTTGTSGWVGMILAGSGAFSANTVTPGMRISNGTEIAVVEEVNFVSALGGTVISQIIYDSGTTGLCTIVPSGNLKGLRRNAMIAISGAPLRILSVTNAQDGTSSFRVNAGSTFSAGNSIVGGVSIWLYTTTTWSPAQTLGLTNFAFLVNPGGAGTGTVAANLGSALNWSNVTGATPATPDDYIHFSILIDHPELLVEGQFILDIDPGTTGTFAAADGNSNAYYKTFRASDFQSVVSASQTTDNSRSFGIETLLQNTTGLPLKTTQTAIGAILSGNNSSPVDDVSTDLSLLTQGASTQLAAGVSQYAEIKFRISEMTHVGSLPGTDLSLIRAIQFRFVVLGNIAVSVGACWLGGGFGPDTATNLTPFLYRARYRSSATGAKSRPGPAIRSGVIAQRQQILLTLPTSSDPQVDKIDIERLGGTAPDWHYVGTCLNSSPTFTDSQYTSAVIVNAPLEVDCFQPFPLLDKPRSSVVSVIGTSVAWTSGDTFNPLWAEDTEVIINGHVTTLYSMPASTTLLFVDDSLPSGSGIVMEIPEPILTAQPLPVLWGPYYDTLFACGNALDAGSVYFTKEFDPDSAPDVNRVEVTSPSETMMNGCMYDSRSYAWSDRRFFSILPTRGQDGGLSFQFTEVRNGKGLISKWAFAVGDKIWYVAADGIYETNGGEPVCITNDIRPMFPQGDQGGEAINGINPVDMTASLRLCFHQSYLFFDYVDVTGAARTLVYDTMVKGWFRDSYPMTFISHFSETGLIGGVEIHNLIGGGRDGNIYQHGGFSDNAAPISTLVWTPTPDMGDVRSRKIFGELTFDLDPKGATITATPSLENMTLDQTPGTFTGGGRQITNPIDLGGGLGVFGKNIGVKFAWSSNSDAPAIYMWEPSFLERPENTFLRATDWGDGGHPGAKLIRGFILEADAQDGSIAPGGIQQRTFKLQGDQLDIQTYIGTFVNQLVIPFAVTPPKPAHLLRIVPADSSQWRLFKVSYIYDPLPEYSAIATPYTDEGYLGAKFVQGAIIEANTLVPTEAIVQFDGDQAGPTLQVMQPGTVPFGAPYSWEPFIAHNLRLAPRGPLRLQRVRWVFEPAPELAEFWHTQGTSHQIPGWQFLRDGYIAHISTDAVHLTIKVDGRNYQYTLLSSDGVYRKDYLIFCDPAHNTPLKGKLFTYALQSSQPFRLFVRDSEIRVHAWGGAGYQLRQPFGDNSFQQGAKI